MTAAPPATSSLRSLIAGIGLPELLLTVLGIVVPIWAWSTWVLARPQHFGPFLLVFCVVTGGVAFAQMVLWSVVRAPGSLRQRLSLSALLGSQPPVYLLAIIVPVVDALAFLVMTPPSTSMADLDPSFSVPAAVGVLGLLGIIAATLGGGVLFWLLVVPVGLLVSLRLSDRADDPAAHGVVDSAPRRAVGYFALLLLSAVGLGVSFTVAGGTARSSTRLAMIAQVDTVIGLEASPAASVAVAVFLVAIVVLLLLFARAQRGRARR